MTHRNNPPQALPTTSKDAAGAAWKHLPGALALLALVLVLIRGFTGAGTGIA